MRKKMAVRLFTSLNYNLSKIAVHAI